MPIRYHIEASAGLITMTGAGTLRYDDIVGSFIERVQDPAYRPGMHLLFDGREALFDVSAADMVRLIEFFEAHRAKRGAGFRFAMVSGVDVTFGLGRMFAALADRMPEDIGVFRDMEAARHWVTTGESVGEISPPPSRNPQEGT